MGQLTVGQMDDLRPKINLRRNIKKDTFCIVWTGAVGGRDTKYPMLYTTHNKKNLNVNVRRYVWEDKHGRIPARHELWSTCKTPMCTNPDHMELRTVYERVTSGNAKPEDYVQQPCHVCARPCRQRGAYIKGVFKAFPQPDGSVLCGICENARARRANRVALTATVRYNGTVDDLIEDVEWLLDFGETLETAATRLKFTSADELQKFLTEIDREDLITRFKRIGVVNDV